jgi:phosphoserine phosphatase
MVVYDFDKTLTYRDTTLGLFLFRLPVFKKIICILYYYVAAVLVRFGIWTVLHLKEALVRWRFKEFSQENWKEHAREFSKTIKTNKLYRSTQWENGVIVVISASFVEVLQHIFPSQVQLFGSQIDFTTETPHIIMHMWGKAKLEELRKAGIFKVSEVYTDSLDDLPLIRAADRVFWVRGDEVTEVSKSKFSI